MHVPATAPSLGRPSILGPLTTLVVWLGRRRIQARLKPRPRPAARDLGLSAHLLRDLGLL